LTDDDSLARDVGEINREIRRGQKSVQRFPRRKAEQQQKHEASEYFKAQRRRLRYLQSSRLHLGPTFFERIKDRFRGLFDRLSGLHKRTDPIGNYRGLLSRWTCNGFVPVGRAF
jgi:hypothetical protein